MHWLGEALKETSCSLHAYALMTNHVHLLLTPNNAATVPKVVISLGRRYVQYINREYRCCTSRFPHVRQEVGHQLLDGREGIRFLQIAAMPVIALAALVIVTYHPSPRVAVFQPLWLCPVLDLQYRYPGVMAFVVGHKHCPQAARVRSAWARGSPVAFLASDPQPSFK